jgi:prophage tail gpP-like protein
MGGVALQIGGMNYEGWHAVSVLRGLEQAAASFSLSVSERTTGVALEPWVLRPGAPCSIWLDGELVLTGYIDTYGPRFDAHAHGVEVRGRSRTADFVDGAAIVPGGQFKQLSLLEIAERLALPFGIPVDALAAIGAPLADVQIQQGETCYAVLERLCRMQGLLVCDGPAGLLSLTRVGSRRAAGALVQGENILGASAELDASQRFSQYIVKGQRANTDDRIDRPATAAPADGAEDRGSGSAAGDTVRACVGAVLDGVVGRYKPWLLTAETQADDAQCQRRAEWEARRRAGHATRASVVVAGWRQLPGGPLWDVNLLVPVISPWLGINRVLLVSTVEFRKDDSGSTTRLELTLPDAYATEGDAVPGAETASGTVAGGGADLWQSGFLSLVQEGIGALLGGIGV